MMATLALNFLIELTLFLFFLNDTHKEKLCFIQFNKRTAASELFDVFTQSISSVIHSTTY